MVAHRMRRAALALSIVVAVASGPAAAINEMFAKDAPIARMNEDDLRMATQALQKALDDGKDGQRYDWKNAATSASGSITPLKAFQRDGTTCRGVKFTLNAGGKSSTTDWNLCKTPGGWKVAEGR